MDRRSNYKNYELPGIYHITLKAAEALRSPFGKVVGKIDKPDGDPEAPSVALTPVGEMVEQELLHSISAHYPWSRYKTISSCPNTCTSSCR